MPYCKFDRSKTSSIYGYLLLVLPFPTMRACSDEQTACIYFHATRLSASSLSLSTVALGIVFTSSLLNWLHPEPRECAYVQGMPEREFGTQEAWLELQESEYSSSSFPNVTHD